ncbi:MAG TPA: hypothetical protein VH601_23470 [Bryobacteraceae bacterium]|jgi:hypothetical protein
MLTPQQLSPANFGAYPPLAKQTAIDHIALFREMPVPFLALLLRELIDWDWKFPAERKELDRQFTYLTSISQEQRKQSFAPFAVLKISEELESTDWVNQPAAFSEKLSAHLWATHQIDSFHRAAVDFFDKVTAAVPDKQPSVNRLAIVTFGQGIQNKRYPLFRKLRPYGTYFRRVTARNGFPTLVEAVNARAARHPEAFAHWHIDGGSTEGAGDKLTRVSYSALTPIRGRLQQKMLQIYGSGTGPEAFRSLLARMQPQDLGMSENGNAVLSRFELSLLTEGSGTQIFSTTFVQWAAREALRRAQPVTLLARFTMRQRERPMNELLTEARNKPELDPQGSVIDADMGAYYTWLNLQRLSGADQAAFVGWFEGGTEAIAVGPKFKRGTVSDAPVDLGDILGSIT